MNETEREAEKQPFVEDFEAKLKELRQAESSAQARTTQGRVLSEQGKVLSEFYDIEQAHRQPGLSPEPSGEFGVMQRFLIKIRFDRDRRRELELASNLLMQCRLAYLRTRFEQRLESSRLQAQIVDAEDRKELDNKLLRHCRSGSAAKTDAGPSYREHLRRVQPEQRQGHQAAR